MAEILTEVPENNIKGSYIYCVFWFNSKQKINTKESLRDTNFLRRTGERRTQQT